MCNDKIRTPASDVSECNINWNAVFFLSSIHCILVSIPWKVLVYPRNKSVRASTIENWSVKPYSSESNEEITCLVGYWFQKKVIPDKQYDEFVVTKYFREIQKSVSFSQLCYCFASVPHCSRIPTYIWTRRGSRNPPFAVDTIAGTPWASSSKDFFRKGWVRILAFDCVTAKGTNTEHCSGIHICIYVIRSLQKACQCDYVSVSAYIHQLIYIYKR